MGRRRACSGLAPRACAPPGLSPREPPLLRGSPMGGPVWFSLPGRGFPLRAPPRVISPRYGVWDDAGGGRNRVRLPGPAIPEISRLLPPPRGGGGAHDRRGRGGGRGEQYMARCRQKVCSGLAPRAYALPGLSAREPLLRGDLVKGPAWFSPAGRGFFADALSGRGHCREVNDRKIDSGSDREEGRGNDGSVARFDTCPIPVMSQLTASRYPHTRGQDVPR